MSDTDLPSRDTVTFGPAWPVSFRDYVLGRKYDYGRGSAANWAFIAFARGDRDFPEIASAAELHAYLAREEVPDALAVAAKSVWGSYTSLCSRKRSRTPGAFGQCA